MIEQLTATEVLARQREFYARDDVRQAAQNYIDAYDRAIMSPLLDHTIKVFRKFTFKENLQAVTNVA